MESSFKNAVIHAVNAGVNIINYSGKTPGTGLTYDAIWYANGNNSLGIYVTVVASAGNDNANGMVAPAYWSGSFSNVIAVGATDHNDIRSPRSNYGSLLNVVAPGGYWLSGSELFNSDDIYSTTPNYAFTLESRSSRDYGYLAGTSMAAPVVSGIAGLMLSLKSDLTPSQIRSIIQSTAEDKGAAGFDNYYGHGRVNAHRALLPLIAPANFQNTAPIGSYITLTWSATSNPILQHYEIERKINNGSWIVIATTTNTSFTDVEVRNQGSGGQTTAQYRVRQKSTNGVYGNYTGIVTATGQYIPIEKKQLTDSQLPSEFLLQQNSPNPFNPSTTIRYEIPEEGFVSLTVFDNLGREIAKLYNGYRKPGAYEATFNAGNLSSGLYFYKLQAGVYSSVKKMLLMK